MKVESCRKCPLFEGVKNMCRITGMHIMRRRGNPPWAWIEEDAFDFANSCPLPLTIERESERE